MATVLLTSEQLNQKRARAWFIGAYMKHIGHNRVVCFTCGHAAAELREAGLDVVEVGPHGDLQTERWWRQGEIAKAWPDRFDATSGHLPVWMMQYIGVDMLNSRWVPDLAHEDVHVVPSGSGETVCCLALADVNLHLVARYDQTRPETTYNRAAPLNSLVKRLVARREGLG